MHACIVKWGLVSRILYSNSPLIKGKILNFKETPRVRRSVFHRKSIVHVVLHCTNFCDHFHSVKNT